MVRKSTFAPNLKLQVSVLKALAEANGLENRMSVRIRKAQRVNHHIEHIELTIRDQFLSRKDMWAFGMKLIEQTVYPTKTVEIESARIRVKGISVNSKARGSGIVTA